MEDSNVSMSIAVYWKFISGQFSLLVATHTLLVLQEIIFKWLSIKDSILLNVLEGLVQCPRASIFYKENMSNIYCQL